MSEIKKSKSTEAKTVVSEAKTTATAEITKQVKERPAAAAPKKAPSAKSTISKTTAKTEAAAKKTPAAKKEVDTKTATKTKPAAATKKATAKTAKDVTAKPAVVANAKKVKILFVASECQPFVATGGLADVAGSLPKAISGTAKNCDIRVVLPLYGTVQSEFRDEMEFVGITEVELAWRRQYCGVFKLQREGVIHYFIDNEYYFKREGQYGYFDDGERYAFFSKAVLSILPMIDFYPDVIHANDWQTALIPVYLKTLFASNRDYSPIRTVFTIHNIAYQGKYDAAILGDVFGLREEDKNLLWYNDCLNLMKGGIVCCDKLSTVSPTYAMEIRSERHSYGLHHVICENGHKLSGIINGIDTKFYDPSNDTALFKHFSSKDVSGKAENKRQLQHMLNLPEDENVPLLAIVSRLVDHKGIDLLAASMDALMQNNIQLVVLGKGDLRLESILLNFERNYPAKLKIVIAFNQDLSRKIYGASDIYLMPSRSEPCGLAQMIASRYGAVPIVHETGGLNDSILDFGTGNGNGFTFKNYDASDFCYVAQNAVNIYYNDKAQWAKYRQAVLEKDFSWEKSAKEYNALYATLIEA